MSPKLIVSLVIALSVAACTPKVTPPAAQDDAMAQPSETQMMMEKQPASQDRMVKEVTDTMMGKMKAMEYAYSGSLADVTQGKTIRGITTGGNATGVANANFDGTDYVLTANFENLPDPVSKDFYEGWVVRKIPFDFISTGRVEKVDGTYVNNYTSKQDLIPYGFYVLTIEPDDGDPAPADHIVEGTLLQALNTN